MINVSIINRSSLADSAVSSVVGSLQTQLDRDFTPVYNIAAKLDFVGKAQKPDPTHWQQVILNVSDEASALGYHSLTSTGLPLGKTFQQTCTLDGEKWSTTLSHELLEMLGDPCVNTMVLEEGSRVRFYAVENCDAVEADSYGIAGVEVSNFVFPCYWQFTTKPGVHMDYLGLIKRPLEIRPAGYLAYYEVGHGWKQDMHAATPHHKKHAKVGSRRHTRTIPMWDRTRSTVD